MAEDISVATLQSLEEQLVIDRHNLEEIQEQHAALCQKVGNKAAIAESLRDRAEAALKEMDAELDTEIREAAETKLTETQIANMVKLCSGHKTQQAEYLRLKELTARWKALVESFKQRSYMISNLIESYGMGYWGPRSGGAVDDMRAILERERQRRKGLVD